MADSCTVTVTGKIVAKGPTGARAFKRVDDNEWLNKKGAWDNSYAAKFGNSGWGAKASETLLQVSVMPMHIWRSLVMTCPFLLLHLLGCTNTAPHTSQGGMLHSY